MEFAKVVAYVSAFVTIISGLLYVVEWVEKRFNYKNYVTLIFAKMRAKIGLRLPLFTAVCVIVYTFSSLIWHAKSGQAEYVLAPVQIQNLKTNYEANFEKFREQGEKLKELGKAAFENGDYAYCILFFKQVSKVYGDVSTNQIRSLFEYVPLNEAAILFHNPTAPGYRRFEQNLKAMVEEAKINVETTKPYFSSGNRLRETVYNLGLAKQILPDDEKEYIKSVSETITDLIPKAPFP